MEEGPLTNREKVFGAVCLVLLVFTIYMFVINIRKGSNPTITSDPNQAECKKE